MQISVVVHREGEQTSTALDELVETNGKRLERKEDIAELAVEVDVDELHREESPREGRRKGRST